MIGLSGQEKATNKMVEPDSMEIVEVADLEVTGEVLEEDLLVMEDLVEGLAETIPVAAGLVVTRTNSLEGL